MTNEQLLTATAKAIAEACMPYSSTAGALSPKADLVFRDAARAASILIVGACVEIADGCDSPLLISTADEDNACDLMAKHIAARIRWLLPM